MLFLKNEFPYFVKMLLLAVVSPACLIGLGSLAMSVVEPKPELGGYVHEWSHVIRAIVFTLSVLVAILCSALYRQEQRRRQSAHGVARQWLQVLLILLFIPYTTIVASNFFIRENYVGGCDIGM